MAGAAAAGEQARRRAASSASGRAWARRDGALVADRARCIGRHYLGVPRRSTATSGSLAGSYMHGSVTDLAEIPGSGGVAHRTPVDFRSRGVRLAPLAVAGLRGRAARGVADRRSAHAGPGGAGLPRRALSPARLRACGTSTGMPGITCRATACCSRRSGRCLGCAPWRCCRCSPRRSCSSAWCARVYGVQASWGAALFAVAAVGDVWVGRA